MIRQLNKLLGRTSAVTVAVAESLGVALTVSTFVGTLPPQRRMPLAPPAVLIHAVLFLIIVWCWGPPTTTTASTAAARVIRAAARALARERVTGIAVIIGWSLNDDIADPPSLRRVPTPTSG
jgi:hypothetical protein